MAYCESVVIKINKPGVRWEDIQPVECVTVRGNTIETVRLEAHKIAQYHANCTGEEVPWNLAGSLQGYYVRPQAEVDQAGCVGRRLGPTLINPA